MPPSSAEKSLSDKIPDGARPDSKGIVRWALRLKPREKRLFRIGYEVEYPAELILEPRRHPAPPASPYAPRHRMKMPSPAPAQQHDINDQIRSLESLF